jgi:hypothetical protein
MASATAFIDTKAHPSADDYYTAFHSEPVTAAMELKVTGTPVTFSGGMNLLDLLKKVLEFRPTDILIVSHGTDSTWSIPWYTGTTFKVDKNAIDVILEVDETHADAVKRVKAAGKSLNADKLKDLKEKVLRIQCELKIEHLAFRACKMGSNERLLIELKKLFAAKSVSAPKLRDAYVGLSSIKPDPASYAAWVPAHSGALVYGEEPDRVAVELTGGVGESSFSAAWHAESSKAVESWAKDYLGYSTYTYKGQTVYVHGFWLYEMGVKQLIYPKDPGFVKQIVYTSADKPAPKDIFAD